MTWRYPESQVEPSAKTRYCRRTTTLSAAPVASVTVSRTKPGPSGSKNSVRADFLGGERHAVAAAR